VRSVETKSTNSLCRVPHVPVATATLVGDGEGGLKRGGVTRVVLVSHVGSSFRWCSSFQRVGMSRWDGELGRNGLVEDAKF